jgi:hypothetical protein
MAAVCSGVSFSILFMSSSSRAACGPMVVRVLIAPFANFFR